MPRGGSREGAGAKPHGEAPKKPYSTKLPVEVVEYLQSTKNAAQTLEETVRRSLGFKYWIGKKDKTDV